MKIKLQFIKEYLWIGVHWERAISEKFYKLESRLDIWICLIPCFPIHIITFKTVRDYRHEPIPEKIEQKVELSEGQIFDLVNNANRVNMLKRKVNR